MTDARVRLVVDERWVSRICDVLLLSLRFWGAWAARGVTVGGWLVAYGNLRAMPVHATRICDYRKCDNLLPPPKPQGGRPQKFCCPKCRQREKWARTRDQARELRELRKRQHGADYPPSKPGNRLSQSHDAEGGRGSPRRGPQYERFVSTGLAEKVLRQELSVTDAADEFGASSHAAVSRWMAAYVEDKALEQKQKAWAAQRTTDLTKLDADGFKDFRDKYFRTPNTDAISPELAGRPYITKPFHLRWFTKVMEAVHGGSKLLILSPPRSNKSEMMIHQVIYLLVHNPNLRILWVGYNDAIAKQSVELIRQELESNEQLIRDFAGPAGTFAPPARSAEPWSNERVTLRGRTIKSKSASLTALGRGGGTLSRDCDLIIVDDIVDHKTVASTAQRENDLRWFRTNLMSRKMRHTGLIVIGSRQHQDDIYRHMLESPGWTSIVERSIEEEKIADPRDLTGNDEHCLFPEIAPYSFLMDQREAVGRDLFDMMYQNKPRAEGMQHFTVEMINAAKNPLRRLGDLDYEPSPGMRLSSMRLVAGLDPATAGYQAGFLWAVDLETKTRFMVDLSNELAGGYNGFRRLAEDWLHRYGLTWWVFEDKNAQGAYLQVPEFRDFLARNGIRVDTHATNQYSKFDPQYGVSAMPRLMLQPSPLPGATQLIDLPYGDGAAKVATDLYAGQCLAFTGEKAGRARYDKSDVLMASWFPEAYFRGYAGGQQSEARVHYRQGWFPSSRLARPL